MFVVQIFDGVDWHPWYLDHCPYRAARVAGVLYLEGLPSRAVPLAWAVHDSIDEVDELYVD